jgi:hypothetical protein
MKHSLFKSGLLATSLLLAAPVFADGTVEAILGPAIGLQKISETWKSGTRTQYSLDFARISAGVSLNVLFGTGLGYTDYGAVLRFFGKRDLLPSSEALSIWYGIGAGVRYAGSVDAAITGMASNTSFGRGFLSPFTRVLWDINGWVAPFMDLSYDFGIVRFGDDVAGVKKAKSSFSAVIGVAFEIER